MKVQNTSRRFRLTHLYDSDCLGKGMGYRHYIDPYMAMLKRSERKAIGYGFLALFLLILAFVAAGIGGDGAGQFPAPVEPVRSTVGLFLLCGSGFSIVAAMWFIGRYVYFVKWPEQFE